MHDCKQAPHPHAHIYIYAFVKVLFRPEETPRHSPTLRKARPQTPSSCSQGDMRPPTPMMIIMLMLLLLMLNHLPIMDNASIVLACPCHHAIIICVLIGMARRGLPVDHVLPRTPRAVGRPACAAATGNHATLLVHAAAAAAQHTVLPWLLLVGPRPRPLRIQPGWIPVMTRAAHRKAGVGPGCTRPGRQKTPAAGSRESCGGEGRQGPPLTDRLGQAGHGLRHPPTHACTLRSTPLRPEGRLRPRPPSPPQLLQRAYSSARAVPDLAGPPMRAAAAAAAASAAAP